MSCLPVAHHAPISKRRAALYALRRTVLDTIVADAARRAGADVRFGTSVTGLRRDRTGRVTGITGRDGPARLEVSADLVIGADGRRSTIARCVGTTAARVAPASSAVIYRYFRDDAIGGYHWHYAAGSAAGVIPTNDGLACVFAATSAERLRRELDGGADAGLRCAVARTAPELAERLDHCDPAGPPRVFPGLTGYLRDAAGPGWALTAVPAWSTWPTSGTCGSCTRCGRGLPTFLLASRTTATGQPAPAAALTVSGSCCLLSPLFFTAGRPWLLAFTAVWGGAVIADSGVFSTLLSELADRRYLGTALTTQTALGFLLTIVTIQAIPLTAAVAGWRYAFLVLAAGPMTALPALTVLSRQMRPNELVSATTERTLP